MTPAQKVCADAADLIERCGWVQGVSEGPNGETCIQSALYNVTSPIDFYSEYSPALQLIRDAIGSAYIPDWNDTPGRTKAEVIAALRKAAGIKP
jgi:hypothetical protein